MTSDAFVQEVCPDRRRHWMYLSINPGQVRSYGFLRLRVLEDRTPPADALSAGLWPRPALNVFAICAALAVSIAVRKQLHSLKIIVMKAQRC